MKDELRECPFCGDTEFLLCSRTRLSDKLDFWVVECGCHVSGPPENTEAEAIAAWNRRATPAPMSEDALVQLCRTIPLHGDAGCDKLTDDEWRAALSAIRPVIEAAVREDERALHDAIANLGEESRQALVPELNDMVRGWEHHEPEVHWIGDAAIAAVYRALLAMIERGDHREKTDG